MVENNNGNGYVTHLRLDAVAERLRNETEQLKSAIFSWQHDHTVNVQAMLDKRMELEREVMSEREARREAEYGLFRLSLDHTNKELRELKAVVKENQAALQGVQRFNYVLWSFGVAGAFVVIRILTWTLGSIFRGRLGRALM